MKIIPSSISYLVIISHTFTDHVLGAKCFTSVISFHFNTSLMRMVSLSWMKKLKLRELPSAEVKGQRHLDPVLCDSSEPLLHHGKNDLLNIMKLIFYPFLRSVLPGVFPGKEIVGNFPKMVSEPWFSRNAISAMPRVCCRPVYVFASCRRFFRTWVLLACALWGEAATRCWESF